ncbi:MAG: hypothetical protein AUI84_02870 [Delftia sp. 13_1_40CM_3_66_6]|nr:MAG: hypothetical protein AUI84_02870 [Delftia sp. 13_1_40CM_3_66_6]
MLMPVAGSHWMSMYSALLTGSGLAVVEYALIVCESVVCVTEIASHCVALVTLAPIGYVALAVKLVTVIVVAATENAVATLTV